ncbi:MAG: tryptophan synthase subunit alpha [Candidatus Omnitrophica bacterium]|nr:tryptophan synthase subunit alpha [Candidatus Omnitrophota bacterium]
MNRIDKMFNRLRKKKAKALIVYLTAGFPSRGDFLKVVKALVKEGLDLLEIGLPFSDPLADGPTIQASSAQALRQGVTPSEVLEMARRIRRSEPDLPLVLMTYYNPVFHYGLKRFCRQAAACGVDGLIVPDLPPEEASDLRRAAVKEGIHLIFLASPTSQAFRLRKISAGSRGFIYYVSVTGVTGARTALPKEVSAHLRAIKRISRLPVCVGFGISRPEHVRQVVRFSDGAVIGSALVDAIRRANGSPAKAAAAFVRPMRKACQ